jgi:hypothetical protein
VYAADFLKMAPRFNVHQTHHFNECLRYSPIKQEPASDAITLFGTRPLKRFRSIVFANQPDVRFVLGGMIPSELDDAGAAYSQT